MNRTRTMTPLVIVRGTASATHARPHARTQSNTPLPTALPVATHYWKHHPARDQITSFPFVSFVSFSFVLLSSFQEIREWRTKGAVESPEVESPEVETPVDQEGSGEAEVERVFEPALDEMEE